MTQTPKMFLSWQLISSYESHLKLENDLTVYKNAEKKKCWLNIFTYEFAQNISGYIYSQSLGKMST